MTNTIKKLFGYINRLPRLYKIVGAVAIVAVAVVALHVATRSAATPVTLSGTSHVLVASVASLSDQTGPLPVVGQVSSISKATILAQSSGEIVTLSHALGDYVVAGAIIAEFENSAQQAAVLQAQGGVAAAQAALDKINVSGASAQSGAVNALLSAYASVDSAVRGTADPMFTNPTGSNPQFSINSSNSDLVATINNARPSIGVIWERETARTGTLSTQDDLATELSTTISEVRTIHTFMDNIVSVLNSGIATQNVSQATINADIAAASAARASLATTLSSLSAAQAALTSAQQPGGSGTSPDVAAGEAALTEAQGALAAARSNLEKSIIRAPISGTIVSLSISQGDFVSSFSQVAQISNPNALEVDTYVTSDDAKTLAIGGTATINGSTKGVIVFIAPALDPTTGKIQVKIGIPGDQSALTDGDTVTVSLERSGGSSAPAKSTITIPIVAAKITPAGPVVFTVSSSTLVANPVTFGDIVGTQVTILKGLTPDMDIVTDARGLSDGQQVIVDANQ